MGTRKSNNAEYGQFVYDAPLTQGHRARDPRKIGWFDAAAGSIGMRHGFEGCERSATAIVRSPSGPREEFGEETHWDAPFILPIRRIDAGRVVVQCNNCIAGMNRGWKFTGR
jgi:hypothetical protein